MRAMRERSDAVRTFARAGPPTFPPFLPSATALGSLPDLFAMFLTLTWLLFDLCLIGQRRLYTVQVIPQDLRLMSIERDRRRFLLALLGSVVHLEHDTEEGTELFGGHSVPFGMRLRIKSRQSLIN